MEPDFSGWATKAGKCADGLTIMNGAFKHQDQEIVPLVWHHNGKEDPENILGHARLTAKEDGIWAECFFNNTAKAAHAKELVRHRDINSLSIWANNLLKKGSMVLHGLIREVSLVMAGANPGATIDPVSIRHSDGSIDDLEDEYIISTGLALVHADDGSGGNQNDGNNTQTDDQKVQEIVDTMTEEQQQILHYMVGEALKLGKTPQPTIDHGNLNQKGEKELKHNNVFDQSDQAGKSGANRQGTHLSHDDMKAIAADALRCGSLRQAARNFAENYDGEGSLKHGVENMGILFPDAKLIDGGPPSFVTRDMAWVAKVIGESGKSPFAKVKSRNADITYDEARAKGYIKGNMKKEEFFSVAQRETNPKTIYKKQKIDRDDMIDITDFDAVVWMKAEMEVMWKEELARAILLSDGRDVADEDKIDETKIRPIATDDPFYVVTVNVDLNDANSTIEEVHDAIILNRQYYKGSGDPTMFTTETFVGQSMLVRDEVGRKIYSSLDDLKTTLRVKEIVTVEVMDGHPDIACIIVNMRDYNIGTDKGGEATLFDDFDIDFNQYKYLYEGRCSGALVKPKSAMVVRTIGAGAVAATASAPAWDPITHTVTIPADANVDYVNASTGAPLADGALVLDPGDVLTVRAVAAAGHYLTNIKVEWSFLRPTGS
jgi:hypothetical protein